MLLSESQRRELELDQPWVRNDFTSAFYGSTPVRGCVANGLGRGIYIGFLIVDRVGIEAWTDHQVNGAVKADSVSGFPAITAQPKGRTTDCTVAVDVGPHEVLDVQYSLLGTEGDLSMPQLCEGAQEAAERAMSTITTSMGR